MGSQRNTRSLRNMQLRMLEMKKKLNWHGTITKSILGVMYDEGRSRDGFEMVFLEILVDLLKEDTAKLSPKCEGLREIAMPQVDGVQSMEKKAIRTFMNNCLNIT